MKIKFAMMVGTCAFALWGCGSDDGVTKPDTSADTAVVKADGGPDTSVVKVDASDAMVVKTDGGTDTMMGDALPSVGDTGKADVPQGTDGAKDGASTDVPQQLDTAGDASGDSASSEVRG
jgi:hypothetical protein